MKKKRTTMSFEPDADIAALVLKAVKATGKTKKEIIQNSLRLGLMAAVDQFLAEQDRNREEFRHSSG